MDSNIINSEEEHYYQSKFVFVFDFESSKITSILHTEYPKYLYEIDTQKIQWLEKFKCNSLNDESDQKLYHYEFIQDFISKNTFKLLIKDDDTTNNTE